MNRFRSHWLALVGAAVLALMASTALGASPWSDDNPNRGQQVSDFVHGLIFGDDESNEGDEEPEDTEDAEDEESSDSEANAHGKCVAEVAHDPDAVGGPNENHGGAVSEAARETCWDTGDESNGGELTDESTSDSHPGKGHGNAWGWSARGDRD